MEYLVMNQTSSNARFCLAYQHGTSTEKCLVWF